MTVTEMRVELEKLEAEGLGDKDVTMGVLHGQRSGEVAQQVIKPANRDHVTIWSE